MSGWRLPGVVDLGNDGCNYSYNGTDCGYNVDTSTGEMAHMFYETLGNKGYYDTSGSGPQSGWGLVNTGPFSNLQDSGYWSGTDYVPSTTNAWDFDFYFGRQYYYDKGLYHYAWAVRDGDVPIPASAWLFLSALAGLGIIKRKHS